MYFPTSYLSHTRKYDLHPYPKSAYLPQQSNTHLNISLSTQPTANKFQRRLENSSTNEQPYQLYSLSGFARKGYYDTTEDMLKAFAFALEEMLLVEKELEKCKVVLWKREDVSMPALFDFVRQQTETKASSISPELMMIALERFYIKAKPEDIEDLMAHFCKSRSDPKLFIDDWTQLFAPHSLEGRKLYSAVLHATKKEVSEESICLVQRVIKMQIAATSTQRQHSQQLWKKLCDFRTVYAYIDQQQKGMILPRDLKEFMEKNCSKTREFDTKFTEEEVRLLIARFDQVGNGYLSATDLVNAFLPKKAYDHRYG